MPAISVEFQTSGVKHVREAFGSIVKAQQEMERQVNRSIANEGKARQKGAASSEQLAEKRYRALTKTLDKEAKDADKVAHRKAKSEEKAAADAVKANEHRFNAIVRRLNEEQRNEEKIAANKMRARERLERESLKMQLRMAAERGRVVDQEVRAEIEKRKRVTGAVSGRIVNSTKNALGAVGNAAGALLAVGGGFSAADAIQTSVKNRGKATDLELQSGGAVKRDEILAKASGIGNAMGMETGAVIEGLDAFVAKSGDVKAGFALIQQLVELATATGADLGELSRTAGIVHMGTGGDTEKTMGQMRTLAGAGRAGSVDMRELSQYAGRISAGATQFADKGKAFGQLSTIVQQAAATGGATAAPEATEAVARLSGDIYKHEESFKALKIGVRDKTGKFLRDPMEIIKESIAKTGGDAGQLKELYGEQSYRAVAGYQDVFNRRAQEVRAAGGKEPAAQAAGLEAIDVAFKKIADASLKEEQVKAEASRRIQEADKQLEMVLNQLREAVGRELVPEFIRMIPIIRDAIPAFAKLLKHVAEAAEWFSAHPFAGLGLTVAGSITKDLAGAGIGMAVKAALVAMMGGGATGTVGGAAGTMAAGGSGVAATLGAAGVGGALGVGAGLLLTERASAAQLGASNAAIGGALTNASAIADTRGMAPADRLAAQKAALAKVQSDIAAAEKAKSDAGPGMLVNFLGRAQNAAGIEGADIGAAQASEQNAFAITLKTLNEQMQKLNGAIKQSEDALKSHATTTSKAPSPIGDPARVVSGAHPVRASK